MPSQVAIVLGHSHIGALTTAVAGRALPSAPTGEGLHLAFFAAWDHNGDPPYVVTGEAGDSFNPAILAEARRVAAEAGAPPTFVSMFGGNAHLVLSLMRHARPFDFVLPEGPDLPLDPGAEVLPSGLVATTLQHQMDRYLYQLFQLRHAAPGEPVLALVPPPPIGDDAFITDRLDAFFLLDSPRRDLSPPLLRLKMWVLQRRLLRRLAESQEVEVMDPPIEGRTADGFLAPDCFGTDATHGGPRYGDLVIAQLERRLGARLTSVTSFA